MHTPDKTEVADSPDARKDKAFTALTEGLADSIRGIMIERIPDGISISFRGHYSPAVVIFESIGFELFKSEGYLGSPTQKVIERIESLVLANADRSGINIRSCWE